MRIRPAHPTSARGMTLVELMIVVVVMAILAAIAWPSLQAAIQRSRRSDAMAALAQVMQAQERWRANRPSYESDLTLLGFPTAASPDNHYTLSLTVENATAGTAYSARATVRAGSPQTADSRCQALVVAVSGGSINYTSVASGGAVNPAPDPCWVR